MKIRKIEISNFRGIKELQWLIPKDNGLICLIGPGDCGKSSILEAIYLTLGDRWNPSIADTDFFRSDVTSPIIIRCIVSDLSKKLLMESSMGLWLSGIDDDGKLYQDPIDGTDPALIVQLRIDDSLEPVWTVERLNGENNMNISSLLRREFATFKVDDRTDVHLRWSRTSALGRISPEENSTGNAMALASRAAKEAIASYNDEGLNTLTSHIQEKLNEVGCGAFCSVRAGLDTSLSSTGGNLALYESNVPLTNYGLGSKKLAGLAIQQLAASGKSILILDEVEQGLEPHRLVQLIRYIQSDKTYSQVFITTHSPVAVEQVSTDNLAVVQNVDGKMTVNFLPQDTKTLQLRRSRPSSFLGRRVIITEGKTEEGFLIELISREDQQRLLNGQAVAAGLGVVIQDGEGGSEVPLRAMAMLNLGYNVAMFLDNDDHTVDQNVAKAIKQGAEAIRWSVENNTEKQIIISLSIPGLSSFLELGAEIRNTQHTVLNDLRAAGMPDSINSLDVSSWIRNGLIKEEAARKIIISATINAKWFKLVDSGKLLGTWVLDNLASFKDSFVQDTITALISYIYRESRVQNISEGAQDAG
ncbi:MAG: ATP-dependent nuclease [Christensenellales bacterium]